MKKRLSDNQEIKFYGTTWCLGSKMAKRALDERKISYQWIDIDKNINARDYVEKVNNGYRSVPTIVFPDGSILVEPNYSELNRKLDLTFS